MLTALVIALRSIALCCRGHRAVALENLALRQPLAVFKRTMKRPRLRSRSRSGLQDAAAHVIHGRYPPPTVPTFALYQTIQIGWPTDDTLADFSSSCAAGRTGMARAGPRISGSESEAVVSLSFLFGKRVLAVQ